MRKIALLAGVEQYRDGLITPLAYAGADALAIGQRLKDRCGFDRVVVLAQRDGHDRPDCFNITTALDELAAELEPEDLFVFYFAGHGIEHEGRAYLLTEETSRARPHLHSLSREVLTDTLGHIDARHRILLFDTCRNSPDRGRGDASNPMTEALARDTAALARETCRAGATTAMYSACGRGKRAYEWPKWGQGVFTHFLLEGLDGPAWRDDELEFKRLVDYTSRHVRDWTGKMAGFQEPQEPWYEEFGAGEVILLSRASEPIPPCVPPPRKRVAPPPHKSPVLWWYGHGNQQIGPVPPEEIRQAIRNGDVTSATEIWREGMAEWLPAGRAPELADLFQNINAPTPEPPKRPSIKVIPPVALATVGSVFGAPGSAVASSVVFQTTPKQEPVSGLRAGTLQTFAGIEMVWCPPGELMMGSPESELERSGNERQHHVTLTRGFWLGRYAVTQGQWEAVMGSNPSHFKGDTRLPVECVSWDDCQAFIGRLNARGEGTFRLPTEAEWEYACRAGTTTPFHFGATMGTHQANYDGNCAYANGPKGEYREKTTVVGSFPANAWGLHDMHGNVCEWCQDWYGDYASNAVTDPNGALSGQYRVLRGGSWCEPSPRTCRSAFRNYYTPDLRYFLFGFRLLRTP